MNKKPTLLYASPFPPEQSGISDYSVVLVKALSKRFNITLYTDNYRIKEEGLSTFPVLRHGVDNIDYDGFDYLLYNIGNNPGYHQYIYEAALEHPGMVILHDMILYYLFVGYYQNRNELYSALYSKQGLEDFLGIKDVVKQYGSNLLDIKTIASDFPLNKEIITSGNLIMVHSRYVRDVILETGLIDINHINHINLIEQVDIDSKKISRSGLYRKYGIPGKAFIIASFGYISETKLNREVAMAVRKIRDKIDIPICYVMVGQGNCVDQLLEDGLIIKTGYTTIDEFNSFVGYAEIVVNMRYPSMGETSGAMLRILQKGKVCITNNGGWFSELPDDCVYKIEIDDAEKNIENALSELIRNAELRNKIGLAAEKYVLENHNAEKIVEQIYEFIISGHN